MIAGVDINNMHVNSVKISYKGIVSINVTGRTSALAVTYTPTIP